MVEKTQEPKLAQEPKKDSATAPQKEAIKPSAVVKPAAAKPSINKQAIKIKKHIRIKPKALEQAAEDEGPEPTE
jgi:hypothetical protein